MERVEPLGVLPGLLALKARLHVRHEVELMRVFAHVLGERNQRELAFDRQ